MGVQGEALKLPGCLEGCPGIRGVRKGAGVPGEMPKGVPRVCRGGGRPAWHLNGYTAGVLWLPGPCSGAWYLGDCWCSRVYRKATSSRTGSGQCERLPATSPAKATKPTRCLGGWGVFLRKISEGISWSACRNHWTTRKYHDVSRA